MKVTATTTLWVCGDCVMHLANGECGSCGDDLYAVTRWEERRVTFGTRERTSGYYVVQAGAVSDCIAETSGAVALALRVCGAHGARANVMQVTRYGRYLLGYAVHNPGVSVPTYFRAAANETLSRDARVAFDTAQHRLDALEVVG